MARRTRGVPWTNMVNVVETGERLVKVLGVTATWDAGADTRGVLVIPGGRDGWIEFAADSRGMNAMMGLSYQGTGAGFADIDFAAYVNANEFDVYEAGSIVHNGGANTYPLAYGVVRVERLAGSIYYKLDGATVYSHALTSAQAAADLYADASFFKAGDYLINWRMSIDELDDAAPICAPLRGVGHLASLLAVSFPSGTRRYSTSPIDSATDGHHEQRLVSVSAITNGIGDRNYSMNGLQVTAVVADEDGSLSRLLATERAHWSAATLRSCSQDLVQASWFTEFTGRLDSWAQAVPVDGVPTFELRFRSDDLALRSEQPGALSSADFPSMPLETIGAPERYIYGRHHAQGIIGTVQNATPVTVDAGGAVELLCVQPWNGSTWVGYLSSLVVRTLMVYVGGIPKTAGGWSSAVSTINGRRMTLVTLTSDPGTDKVTADCDGYDWYGNGAGHQNHAGGPEHAVDAIKHWLANFVFNVPPTGGWFQADPAKIDLPSFADVKLALGRVAAARVLEGGRARIEELNAWAQSFGVYPVFTRLGKVGLVLDDPLVSAADQYAAPLILAQRAGDLECSWPGEGQAKRVVLSFAHANAEGRYLGTHEVQDPDVSAESVAKIECPWSPAMLLTTPTSVALNDAGANPALCTWVRAKSLAQDYPPGTAISTIRDQSGLGLDFLQATGSLQPIFRFYPWEERAWIEYDGTDDNTGSGVALSNFKVAGGWTCAIALRVRSWTHDANVVGTATNSRCQVRLYNSAGQTGFQFRHDDGSADTLVLTGLLAYQWYVVIVRHVGGNIYLGVNDGRKLSIATAASGNTTSLTDNFAINPGGTAPIDLAELVVFKDDAGENTQRVVDYMLAEHVFRFKSSVHAVKDVGSRYLANYRRPRLTATLECPPDLAVLDLGRIVRVQHPLGSAAPTVGWGASGHGARPFRVVGRDREAVENRLRLTLADVRDVCVTWRDTGATVRGHDSGRSDWVRAEGVARLG